MEIWKLKRTILKMKKKNMLDDLNIRMDMGKEKVSQ